VAMITGLHSVSIFVADVPATVAFYVDRLGFDVEERTERMTMLRTGDLRLLVHIGGPPSAPPDLALHLHLWVDGVDEMYEQLRDGELEIEEPVDRPWGLRTFHVHDPNGYVWELMEEIDG